MNEDIRLIYLYFLHHKWKFKVQYGILEEENGSYKNRFGISSLSSMGLFIFNYAANKT